MSWSESSIMTLSFVGHENKTQVLARHFYTSVICTDPMGHTLLHKSQQQQQHICIVDVILNGVHSDLLRTHCTWRIHVPLTGLMNHHSSFICGFLPAAVAPGRSDTVMSGGKLILGGSSTSASGPSAMLLKCHTVHLNRYFGFLTNTGFYQMTEIQRCESDKRHQNKQT